MVVIVRAIAIVKGIESGTRATSRRARRGTVRQAGAAATLDPRRGCLYAFVRKTVQAATTMGANDISISELRQHLAEYLTRVRRGETLRVTQHGAIVARIEPALSGKEAAKARMEEIRKTAKLGDVITPINV